MKIRIQPDRKKASSLKDMARVTFERLKEIDRERYPSNTLKDYYDILKALMEAIMYLDGIKIKGDGAHYETIEYICKEYDLNESRRILLQDIREYRNRISYEGFNVKSDYIKQNTRKIEKMINILLRLINRKG